MNRVSAFIWSRFIWKYFLYNFVFFNIFKAKSVETNHAFIAFSGDSLDHTGTETFKTDSSKKQKQKQKISEISVKEKKLKTIQKLNDLAGADDSIGQKTIDESLSLLEKKLKENKRRKINVILNENINDNERSTKLDLKIVPKEKLFEFMHDSKQKANVGQIKPFKIKNVSFRFRSIIRWKKKSLISYFLKTQKFKSKPSKSSSKGSIKIKEIFKENIDLRTFEPSKCSFFSPDLF